MFLFFHFVFGNLIIFSFFLHIPTPRIVESSNPHKIWIPSSLKKYPFGWKYKKLLVFNMNIKGLLFLRQKW